MDQVHITPFKCVHIAPIMGQYGLFVSFIFILFSNKLMAVDDKYLCFCFTIMKALFCHLIGLQERVILLRNTDFC